MRPESLANASMIQLLITLTKPLWSAVFPPIGELVSNSGRPA